MRKTVMPPTFCRIITLLAVFACSARLSAEESDVVFEVVHSFHGEDGAFPNGGLTAGPGGELYGISAAGGAHDGGTGFKIATDGAFAVLHSFDPKIAFEPFAGVALGGDGNFYGVTHSRSPIIALADAASGLTITTQPPPPPPPIPISAKVYRLTPQGQFATVTELTFEPQGRLTAGRDGNLYGATYYGTNFKGGLYQVTLTGGVTMEHSFNGTDGSQPDPGTINGTGTNTFGAGLIEGATGEFYGLTRSSATQGLGTLFRYSLKSGLTTLHTFSADEGLYPGGGLLLAADGTIFGTTNEGGPTHVGTVFKFSSSELTTLHAFSLTDGHGWYPESLTLAPDGYFYGTNSLGGPAGTFLGSIFKMSPTGELTTIHAFTAEDGAKANGPLVNGADGNLYGMTSSGGEFGRGTIFRIRLGALNRAPVAVADEATFGLPGGGAPADGRVVIDVLANDFDLDSQDQVQLLHVFQPAHGTAKIVPLSDSPPAGDRPAALAIEYRPEAGFSGEDAFTYSISDGRGATASAKVTVHISDVAILPIFRAGRFHARLADDRQPGYLRIALTAPGAFTGEIRLGPEVATVRGTFSTARTATVDLAFPHSKAAKLQLALSVDSASMGGSIEFADRSIDFTASRIPGVSEAPDSARPKHRYTALLLSPTAGSATGYLVIATTRSGDAVILGQTADGMPFSSRASQAADGSLEVFSRPGASGSRADVVGEIIFGTETNATVCRGELLWRRLPGEGGPDVRLEVLGEAYVAPARGQRPLAMPQALVRIGFNAPMTQAVDVLPSGELIAADRRGDSPTLRINPISGAFRGVVTDPTTGRRHLARGVILQQAKRGAGFAADASVTVDPL